MKLILTIVLAIAVAGCSQANEENTVDQPLRTITDAEGPGTQGVSCDAGNERFVRNTIYRLWGRHPKSAREVHILLSTLEHRSREQLIQSMMRSQEYLDRWADVLKDAILINRYHERANLPCNGDPLFTEYSGELATHIRDTAPGGTAYDLPWNMVDLIRSALVLDDLSPIYRAGIFAQAGTVVFDAENEDQQRAYRTLYANIFERHYLNRKMVCLSCHNSETSVTPEHTFPVPGLFEKALYGDSAGRPDNDLISMFRVKGVLSLTFVPEGFENLNSLLFWKRGPGISPWGMALDCGQFIPPDDIEPDPLDGQGFLIEEFGQTSSLWDVEAMMHAGFGKLRDTGLELAEDGTVDGEMAMAWLIAMSVTEKIWREVTGHRLTAPHFLPRNTHQRDVLKSLTDTLVNNGFSLRKLLTAILMHPYLNQALPSECEPLPSSYYMPPLFDPWVISEDNPDLRGNSAGELVSRRAPRTLLYSATQALEWPKIQQHFDVESHDLDDASTLTVSFLRDIGVLLGDGEIGFRGSNFQETLAWEAVFGQCTQPFVDPETAPDDWINRLVATAGDQTMENAVIALKDRLLADPTLSDKQERGLVEELLAAPLDEKVASITWAEDGLRRVCTALLASPQFQLQGIPRDDAAGNSAVVEVPGSTTPELCATLEPMFAADGAACDEDGFLVFD